MQETVDLGRDLPKWAKVHNLKQLAGHGLIASDKGNLLLTQMPNQSFWFGTFTLKE
jgi:hypothetical protein